MKYLLLTSLVASIFISGCIRVAHYNPNNKPHSNKTSKLTSASNKGTICAYKSSSDEIVVKYYPLSSNCISSSSIDWKLAGFDTNLQGTNLKIDSYALYKKNNSPIATADCGGAKIKIKKLKVPKTKTTLYWGDKKLADISNKNILCFKRVGDKIESVKPFR